MDSVKTKDKIVRVVIHVILIIMSIIMLVPFLWMVLTAFKTVSESTSVNPFVIFPSSWKFDNFVTVWKNYNFLILYKNTLLMIFFRVLCAVLTATMAGYAFGRLRFPGKNFLFALVLVQMMVPPQIFLLPQYLMMSKIHMLNTEFALVFPGLVTAFGTFLLKTSYQGLPRDLEEAASIDGASGWVKMKNIVMPLMMSSVTICLFLTLSRAFMVYDLNLSLTAGAPYGTTEMAAMHVYEKAFTSRQFGVGQAEALILFIIVACISGIQVYLTKKQEVEA